MLAKHKQLHVAKDMKKLFLPKHTVRWAEEKKTLAGAVGLCLLCARCQKLTRNVTVRLYYVPGLGINAVSSPLKWSVFNILHLRGLQISCF